jgi:predicted PurR-regulated permease PerM
MDDSVFHRLDRARLAWWGVVAVLGVALTFFVASFVGTFVLGLFVYYAARPLHRRLRTRVDHRGLSATLTMLFLVLPAVALVGYAGLVAVQEFAVVAGPGLTDAVLERLPGDPRSVGGLLRSPTELLGRLDDGSRVLTVVVTGFGALGTAANGLLHLTLALAVSFFLLRDGPRLAAWFRADVAGAGGVADAYLTAVDADLETVYFGNVLTVLLVGVAAVVVYNGFNVLAPATLRLPVPTLLALLTGLATFVPLVVGKLVYVPMCGYLAWEATRAGAGSGVLPWVVGFLVVSFLLLDLLPQTFLRPLVSGRSLHSGLVLFAYVLGAALFGWYGLFLGPLLVVLVVQAASVVLPELLHGERLTVAASTEIGAEPRVDGTGGGPDERGDDGLDAPDDTDGTDDVSETSERRETGETDRSEAAGGTGTETGAAE